jgi:hypothetical protein
MKHQHESFVKNLRKKVKSLKRMKPGEVHVFTINANYGRYKIIVGPMKPDKNCPVEIDGEVHHLFVSPKKISPNPSQKQIRQNLRHTVIMRDLSVHINDPSGSGKQPSMTEGSAKPRECINLAGKEGEKIIRKAQSHGKLSLAAYNIIQKDIIHSLKEEEKSLT